MRNVLLILNLCSGITQKLSVIHCQGYQKIVENIINTSGNFDYVFIINDDHRKEDIEFNYLPPHMINKPLSLDNHRLINIEKDIATKYTFLTKSTLSVFKNKHNSKLIMSQATGDLVVSGFVGSLDIVPTVLDAMQLHPNVKVIRNCIGDLTPEKKAASLNYLTYMGIRQYEC